MDRGLQQTYCLPKGKRLILPGQFSNFRNANPQKQIAFPVFSGSGLEEPLHHLCFLRIAKHLQSYVEFLTLRGSYHPYTFSSGRALMVSHEKMEQPNRSSMDAFYPMMGF